MTDEITDLNSSLKKKPGDIIRSADWNILVEQMAQLNQKIVALQKLCDQTNKDLSNHDHTPEQKGQLIKTASMAKDSIDGSIIQASSSINIKKLAIDQADIADRLSRLDKSQASLTDALAGIEYRVLIEEAPVSSNPVEFELHEKKDCLFIYSATGYISGESKPGIIKLRLIINQVEQATVQRCVNEQLSHKCFQTGFARLPLPPGRHSLYLNVCPNSDGVISKTDQYDYAHCAALFIPCPP